jgi:glycosyltransferase involved in cell wall biosynthesis
MENKNIIAEKKEENPGVCAFLCTFPPKECGIATFSQDLTESIAQHTDAFIPKIIAVSEDGSSYEYGNDVILNINRDNIIDYFNAAKKINSSDKIKLVCIQHEYGIFGGMDGDYLIAFLETIKKPIAITFHSVIPVPDISIDRVTKYLVSRADAIIVTAQEAIKILKEDYDADEDKIHVVYHGIPTVEFQDTKTMKDKLGLNNRIVLSTFGLLNEEKGIEYMIQAMPELVKKYPNILYQVIGQTHPMARKEEGETYRERLIDLVKDLGLENHVSFHNRFLSLQEILNNLLATDIYIFTNLDYNQISSGTLSYALGCGKAVVATPVAYSKEILSEDRGLLIEFKNPQGFTKAVDSILSNTDFKKRLETNSYNFTRQMTWPNVAKSYSNVFKEITSEKQIEAEVAAKLHNSKSHSI